MHQLTVLSTIILTTVRAIASGAPPATIPAGTVQGGVCDGNPNGVFYKSIPYAKPPTGRLRFEPPKPYSGKYPGGVIDGTRAPPACLQFSPQFAETGPTSEDCLYLNIWTPANATSSCNLPVRVWLYGGGNLAGGISNAQYDGCSVVETGAVMVSINYRLGPMGFLALPNTGFGGNQGLQDVLLGLQWVQDNIAAFGGDPKKVLLHGESAGAIDSFAIASLKQAPKLFSSATFQSGGGSNILQLEAVQNISTALAQSLNCSTTTSSCLQNAPAADIFSAFTKLPQGNSAIVTASTPGFGPCVDGHLFNAQPVYGGVRVPSIFGTNSMEGTLVSFGPYFSDPNGPTSVEPSDYDIFLNTAFGPLASQVKAQYPLSAFNSTRYPALYAIAEVSTAYTFRCPARRALEATARNGIPVYTYRFAHAPKCAWSPPIPQSYVPLLGATHSSDVPFVLGHTSQLPPPNGTCEMTNAEKAISAFMTGAWTNMASHQRPGSALSWPAWVDTQQSLGVNIVNVSSPGRVAYDDCTLWDDINRSMT